MIIAQAVYVFHFFVELTHLVAKLPILGEADFMLIVLVLIGMAIARSRKKPESHG